MDSEPFAGEAFFAAALGSPQRRPQERGLHEDDEAEDQRRDHEEHDPGGPARQDHPSELDHHDGPLAGGLLVAHDPVLVGGERREPRRWESSPRPGSS